MMKQVAITFRTSSDFIAVCERSIWGRVNTPTWYLHHADITLDNGKVYKFKMHRSLKPFWSLSLEDKKLLELHTFCDDIKIVMVDGSIFTGIMTKGFFRKENCVTGNNGVLFTIRSYFDWKQFDTVYTIECACNFGNKDVEKAIVMMCMRFYKTVDYSD